jgi:serine/threonine-protein kinase
MTVAASLLDGRYSLDEQIGAGGFCEVWRGTDTVLGRPVAVKLLHAGYAHQPETRARFQAEARHAGALSHPNIARVYDYGEPARGQPYLVMELIEGPSLATVLAAGPLDVARTMDMVAQAAAGLQAAHSAGVIHRDIKPANTLFTSDGTVQITDFGIAYAVGSAPLTASGMVMGTPGYIAPERVAGAQAGPASDLYALGIVAFECLTGARPFAGPPLEVAIAHRDRPLPPLPTSVPGEVAALVMMLTAKDPAWRPRTAGEVANQARQLRDHLVSDAASARQVPGRRQLPSTGAPQNQARDAPRCRTRTGRSPRPGILTAALVALAALACLVLLTITGLASPSHPSSRLSSGPPQAAARVTQPPSTASPGAAQSAPPQRSATPDARMSAVAAVTHTSIRHPTTQPGPPRDNKRPGPGHDPGPPSGPRHGAARRPGNGPGPAPRPGPASSQVPVAAAAGTSPSTA